MTRFILLLCCLLTIPASANVLVHCTQGPAGPYRNTATINVSWELTDTLFNDGILTATEIIPSNPVYGEGILTNEKVEFINYSGFEVDYFIYVNIVPLAIDHITSSNIYDNIFLPFIGFLPLYTNLPGHSDNCFEHVVIST